MSLHAIRLAPGDISADQSSVRRANLALVLNMVVNAPKSRSDIAKVTGMTRGTVGTLVAELQDRGLASLGETRRGGTGRPGTLVGIYRNRVIAMGLGMSDYFFNAVITDLCGNILISRNKLIGSERQDVDSAVRSLADLAHETLALVQSPEMLLAGIGVSIPGLVDTNSEIVRSIPGTGWKDVRLKEMLDPMLPPSLTPVHVYNAASVGAVAEQRIGGHEVDNLIYLTGSGGMDAGFLIDGREFRGGGGFAGEVGHMLIDPQGRTCRCGRRGCWEAEVGLNAVLERLADPDDVVRNTELDIDQRTIIIMQRAREKDQRTLDSLGQTGAQLGKGIANLINIVNPQIVVGGGYIGRLFEWLQPAMREEIVARALPENAAQCRIVPSVLGGDAAAVGGAIAALSPILADPTLVPIQNVGQARPAAS